MDMPALGLALFALYGLLAVGMRMAVQVRRTGSTGLRMLNGASGSMEWVCGVLLVAAVVLGVAGPVLQLTHVVEALAVLDGGLANVLGVLFAALGIAITVLAQLWMGDSWRIGVDSSERTALVTDGPFAVVRNPIFTAMIPAFVGVALLAANAVTVAGAGVLIVALELQTRLVEEPYLRAVHGERYALYSSRVGRFLPGVGRAARRDRLAGTASRD